MSNGDCMKRLVVCKGNFLNVLYLCEFQVFKWVRRSNSNYICICSLKQNLKIQEKKDYKIKRSEEEFLNKRNKIEYILKNYIENVHVCIYVSICINMLKEFNAIS